MTNMIVCPEPPAAEAGRAVFAQGGNAVDAAVAAAFVQGVTNPLLCGLGGTGLFYYYDATTRRRVVLNCETATGSRPVPHSWTREYVGRAETIGRYAIQSEANQVGHTSVMTPGFVRGCWVAARRFGSGRVPWGDLLAPAVRLAYDGFTVYPYAAASWHPRDEHERPGYPGLRRKLGATPDATRFYLRADGSGYREGDLLRQPDVARTIQRLADAGGDDFYAGEVARVIAADFARHGGFIAPEDLRDYPVDEEPPVVGHYRGFEVSSAGASGSGPQLIEMLHILEQFDLPALGHNTPAYIDTLARVQRAAFADNVRLKGIAPNERASLEAHVVSRERAADWARRIKAGDRIVVRGGAVDPGTTHLTCVDATGNVVTFTHSIGSLAGSGVVTPGLGFLYNNFLGHFNPLPGHPDSIAPGKKMGGGVPTILFKDGSAYLAVGAPGGSRLLTSTLQVILNAIDHGMDLATAVSVPRFHSEEAQLVFVEPAVSEATVAALRAMGNTVERSTYMSRVQAIRMHPDGLREAGPDPRGGAGVGRYP